ncbi:MAG: hypothetical protein QOC58_871 [Mycobacterium sp.]|jgi:polyketide cyclase/dehydrase/lipid transport protein|nr:hypothetical protein [Mycobacterium sp.]
MTVTRDVDATCERVWEVLANGWTYSSWVVGNSRTRAVSRKWPSPGARILHSIGAWPAVIDDETVVESWLPREELVLFARVRPATEARVTLRLTDTAVGCRVTMSEVAVSGPLSWLPESVQAAAFAPRNRECLWRLAQIAAGRDPDELQTNAAGG